MITDVDTALTSLLTEQAATFRTGRGDDQPIRVELESADRPVTDGPAISLLLYDIAEDLDQRDTGNTRIRDEEGRVVGLLPPKHSVRLSYLVSVVATDPRTEHWILGELLAALVPLREVPEDHVPTTLSGERITLTTSSPRGRDQSVFDLWNALGRKLRPALTLVAETSVRPAQIEPDAPPVRTRDVHVRRMG